MQRAKKTLQNTQYFFTILALFTIATITISHELSGDQENTETRFIMGRTDSKRRLAVPITRMSPKVKVEMQEYLDSTSQDSTLFMVYIAADNDLRSFAIRNIEQMAKVGSNENLIIIVHLDIRIKKNQKVTRRYLILKDKIIHLNPDEKDTQRMDSGNPNTLISFCKFAIETFPAQKHALVFWDHGTGALDPKKGRIVRAHEKFIFNSDTKKYDLDRSSSYMDLIEPERSCSRGICWDDTTGNYLTSHDLDFALGKITSELLGGEKLNILAFDACLMSMIEIASIAKRHAEIMIGSQEVILGPGFQYKKTLAPFQENALTSLEFAKHIVATYSEVYDQITGDYTLSAINLKGVDQLEKNINEVALLLKSCLSQQVGRSVKKAIHASRSKPLCTHFDWPGYIDIDHFYHNLEMNLKLFNLTDKTQQAELTAKLKQLLEAGQVIIRNITIANATGKKLSNAQGLSIYFPERTIHSSYRQAPFAKDNAWPSFLTTYHKR